MILSTHRSILIRLGPFALAALVVGFIGPAENVRPAVPMGGVNADKTADVTHSIPPVPRRGYEGKSQLRRAPFAGPFEFETIRVIDGDTFEARVRVWFGHEITTLVRIRGIDAPEIKSRCGDEGRGAQAAKQRLEQLLGSGRASLHDVAMDKYGGRIVASVAVQGSRQGVADIAQAMLASGLARPYGGGRRESWCAVGAAEN